MFRTIKQARVTADRLVLGDGIRQHFAREEVERMLDKREKDSRERGFTEGHTKGFEDGIAKAIEEGRARVEQRLAVCEGLLRELNGLREQILTDSQTEVVKLAMVIASKVIHREVEESGAIVESVQEAIRMASDKHAIRVRLHPADVSMIDSCTRDLRVAFKGLERIELIEDEEIIRGGCVVETAEGSIDARLDRQMDEIRKILLGG